MLANIYQDNTDFSFCMTPITRKCWDRSSNMSTPPQAQQICGGHNNMAAIAFIYAQQMHYPALVFRSVFFPFETTSQVSLCAHKLHIVSYIKYSLRSGRSFQSHDLTILCTSTGRLGKRLRKYSWGSPTT